MNCDRKTLFGRPACNFEARYDEVREPAIEGLSAQTIHQATFFDQLPMATKKTYVHDICTACGMTVERTVRNYGSPVK